MTLPASRFRQHLLGLALLAVTLALAMPVPSWASSGPSKRPVASKSNQAKAANVKKRTVKRVVARKPVSAKNKRVYAQVPQGRVVAKIRQSSNRETSKLAAASAARTNTVVRVVTPARLTNGERMGLRHGSDPLDLSSSVALVIDQETNEVLFSKNDQAVLPIASLTKLMTGLVIAEAGLSMDAPITITGADVDTYKGSRSRLAIGTTLTRGELMHLSLMSSENRAAHALGRTYPGGMIKFVNDMNAKARELGMMDTRYVEPTGLSSENKSSARDLATLVSAAYERPMLRDLSTSPSHQLDLGRRTLQYNNSNRLIHNPAWDIGLQKTGYISEAGRCLVMQARVAGRQVIMVFLDAAGTLSRNQDAERVRRWVEAQTHDAPLPVRPQG
jgi:D-alanyl-D-alanine endopeptidase (penicillin-binding protein 7)